ncbi:hypothetical protein QTP88_008128 [Uroleucon formosanum]
MVGLRDCQSPRIRLDSLFRSSVVPPQAKCALLATTFAKSYVDTRIDCSPAAGSLILVELLSLLPRRPTPNKCNIVDGLTQCSSSSSTSLLNTDCSSSSSEFCEPPSKQRRTYIDKNFEKNQICSSERTEEIHQALAKMITINQIPLSFCSSSGFKQFMSIVEPNYIICKESAIKQRLKGLKLSAENLIKKRIKRCQKSSQYLKDKQEQLGMPTESLIQSCKTRWNSIYMMLDRIYKNRCPISNVLADCSLTTAAMAHKFEVSEHQWTNVETLIKLLKPFQIMTTVFCGEKYCSSSMVRPLLNAVIEKHLKHNISDNDIAEHFKTTGIRELSDRFKLLWTSSSDVTARQIASFLDPRFEDLEHETVDAREEIRSRVKHLINEMAEINCDVQIKIPVTKYHGALEFLFDDEVNCNIADSDIQYQNYLAEPQLKFDFDALEWWKTHTSKYPLIVALAMKYLRILATSVSSE